MSDFVYVITLWSEFCGEWSIDKQLVVTNDEYAEEKVRNYTAVPESVELDFNKLFSGEIDGLWITESVYVDKCELL